MSDLINSARSTFDKLKCVSPKGIDYWSARDLMQPLGYSAWKNFTNVIEKARHTCESVGQEPDNHIYASVNMVSIGSGAKREKGDFYLSRYGAYLVAMNGDPRIPEIAAAKRYFAVQTRRQELADDRFGRDIEKRLALRERVTEANILLGASAKDAGVQNYALFHDAGYRGLYNMGLRDIKKRKGLAAKENLLDRAGRTELAANEFRITQTLDTLEREQIRGEKEARETHRQVGTIVRKTIEEIGGTLPENLPPQPSIKKIAAKVEKEKQLEDKRDK